MYNISSFYAKFQINCTQATIYTFTVISELLLMAGIHYKTFKISTDFSLANVLNICIEHNTVHDKICRLLVSKKRPVTSCAIPLYCVFQDDDLEEGEVKDPTDRKVRPRPICRFFMKGRVLLGNSVNVLVHLVSKLTSICLVAFYVNQTSMMTPVFSLYLSVFLDYNSRGSY